MTEAEDGLSQSLLSDQAYVLLRKELLSASLEPGTRLVESEIARRLKVSQAPVREALRRLAHEGLVLQFPRRGSFVAHLSAEQARDAYAIRAPLEVVAVEGVLGSDDPNRVPTLVASLDEQLDAMLDAAEDDDLIRFVTADAAFHRTVWEASGNELLTRVWPMLEVAMRNLTVVSNRLYYAGLGEVAATHRPLIDALRQRDPAAPRLFQEHAMDVWKHAEETPEDEAAEDPGGEAGQRSRRSTR